MSVGGKHPALKVIAIILSWEIGGFAFVIVFLLLSEYSFGFQIGTALGATAFLPWYVFLKTNFGRAYSLRDPRVRRALPLLLAVHGVFTIAVFCVQTAIIRLKPILPTALTTESGPKHDSWYLFFCIVLLVAAWCCEIAVARRILWRRVQDDPNPRSA